MRRLGTDIRKGAAASYSRLCFPVRAAGVAGLGAIARLGAGTEPSPRTPYLANQRVDDYTVVWIAAGQPTILSAETDPGNPAVK